MNQCSYICSRAKHHIHSYQPQKHFLQRIVSTSNGEWIPLLYPISMIFPSIGYNMILPCSSISGALPSCLMATKKIHSWFLICCRSYIIKYENPVVATSPNPKYMAYGYDVLTDLTLNNEDTHLILNQGLTVCPDGLGLQLRSKSDSRLGDSTQLIVKLWLNFYASRKNTIL